jgi:putative nucleotidyltransferase with HDIG domain
MPLNRESSWELLTEYTKSESLRKHALAVEALMRAYAKKYGEDPEVWGIVGLLHDFDYEKYPSFDAAAQTGHPFEGVKQLQVLGYPENITTAILGHALYSGVPRTSNMAKALFACDELCGFLLACALMRPERLMSLDAKSVRKKMKYKK